MRLMNSARSGESRREHLHEALVASTTEAQDLLVPLHDRSSNLAISSLLECCFLLRCSAWASQQAYCILVNLIIFFFFLRCFVFITSILDELSDISDKLQQLLFFSHRHFFYSRPWVRWTQLFFCYFLSSLKTSSDAQKSLPLRFSNPRTPPPPTNLKLRLHAFIVLGTEANDEFGALCCSNVQKDEQMDDTRFQQTITFEQLR